MHVLETKRHMYFISKDQFFFVPYALFLSVMAEANQTHNILVLETCKVKKLHLKLLMVKVRLGMKQLNGNRLTSFVYTLFNIAHAPFSNLVGVYVTVQRENCTPSVTVPKSYMYT
jgi:hypothetical protein